MKLSFVFVFLVSIFTPLIAAENKKCRALILEGGGPRNAYSAGVLKAIVNLLPKEERAYDVVSGISMGAVNAFILGMHAPGDEEAAVNEILKFWLNLEQKMVYQNWFLGFLEGLTVKSGLYNNEPYTKTMNDLVNSYKHGFLRSFCISLTDLNSGIFPILMIGTRAIADETSNIKNFPMYLKASAVTPGFFPPVIFNNTTLCDGTIISTANIPEAIKTCRMIADDEDIILDLIMIQEGNFLLYFHSEDIGEGLQEVISIADDIEICKSEKLNIRWKFQDMCHLIMH
jgi:predicted acylesterase/phospholipase RssA